MRYYQFIQAFTCRAVKTKNSALLCELMCEVFGVDSALFREAGLEPGLLHRDGLGVLTQQVLELLVHTSTETYECILLLLIEIYTQGAPLK